MAPVCRAGMYRVVQESLAGFVPPGTCMEVDVQLLKPAAAQGDAGYSGTPLASVQCYDSLADAPKPACSKQQVGSATMGE